VEPTVAKLGASTGRRITLTTPDRVTIARSSAGQEPLSQKESAPTASSGTLQHSGDNNR